jgi:DNA-binding IclR family transcriptional regulator
MGARATDERFDVRRSVLIRQVVLSDGRRYTHRCERATYEAVAHAIDERGSSGGGVALEPLARELGLPFTQVAVALAFLKERGCVMTEGRRNYPPSKVVYEDAMVEFTYLDESPY